MSKETDIVLLNVAISHGSNIDKLPVKTMGEESLDPDAFVRREFGKRPDGSTFLRQAIVEVPRGKDAGRVIRAIKESLVVKPDATMQHMGIANLEGSVNFKQVRKARFERIASRIFPNAVEEIPQWFSRLAIAAEPFLSASLWLIAIGTTTVLTIGASILGTALAAINYIKYRQAYRERGLYIQHVQDTVDRLFHRTK